MTTASVQDIDAFIRLQKEKLSRDRYSVPNPAPSYFPPQNPNFDYNRQQLENYLNLPRNPSDPALDYLAQQQYQLQQQQQQQQFNNPRSQSPLLLAQQLQKDSLQTDRITKQYNNNPTKNEEDTFFKKFGSKYDQQKSKLKNELHQEYLDYMQQKNLNESRQKSKNQQVSDQFYATLPLEGLGASKENAKKQRNFEYNILKEKSDNKRNSLEWRKNRNDPEIKPYSKHNGSEEILNNIKNTPFSNDIKTKSQSQFDVQLGESGYQNEPLGYELGGELYRTKSANSYENLNRGYPIEPFRTPVPPVSALIDPSLTQILRRPPVGLKSAIGQPQAPTRVQFNDQVRYSEFPSNGPQINFNEPIRNENSYRSYPSNQQLNNITNTAPKDESSPFNFSENQNKNLKALKQREYQEELQRQVREKQLQKQKEKEEQDKYDKKFLLENQNYNPYGRGGAGAPIKDKDGNIIANLSQVKADPFKYSPRETLPPSQNYLNNFVNSNNQNSFGVSSRSNSNELANFFNPPQAQTSSRKPGPNDEPSFARGGNGIFGEAKSDDQKKKEEKYKAELQKQIEEKQRLKALEKERIRLEEEKEQQRIEEESRKIKAELEEEERKKKLKEENDKKLAENAKRIAEENKLQNSKNKRAPIKPENKRTIRKPTSDETSQDQFKPERAPSPQAIAPSNEFRTNSPPIPALIKDKKKTKNSDQKEPRKFSPPPPAPNSNKPKSNATADYYITESRLNVSSPKNKKITSDLPDFPDGEERPSSNLITEYDNNKFKDTNLNKKPPFKNKTNPNRNTSIDSNVIPTKPVLRKVASRPSSQVSNSEVLAQLQSLKKHLHNELAEVENKVYNNNDRTTVGQLADLHHNILNVRTPPGDKQSYNGSRTYRKEIETPPINGGLEPRTYFRDNTVLLGAEESNNNIFSNNLQRQAHERQMNRLNLLQYQNDSFRDDPINEQLATQNQLRLKKLRDMEDDSLSMNDPNDVLNKFISRNNRQPSAGTIQDDTWLRQPA